MGPDRLMHRAAGAMVGAVVGDALGVAFEGRPGPIPATAVDLHVRAGGLLRYSDDTALTLALADWLLGDGDAPLDLDLDLDLDRLARYLASAYREDPDRGYGRGAADLLGRVADGGDWRILAGTAFGGQGSFGNGAAMRVAPVAVVAAGDPDAAAALAARSAVVTHTHPEAVDGAAVQAAAVTLALAAPPDRRLDPAAFLAQLLAVTRTDRLRRQLDLVGWWLGATDPAPAAAGLVERIGNGVTAAESVPAAVACFLAHPDSFPAAVDLALTLGGDTDTIASMTGAMAGARHGRLGIPADWQRRAEGTGRAARAAAALVERYA